MSNPEKKKYKKNFLTQVIYQVLYQTNESIDDASMKAFKDKLGDQYSVLETVKQQGLIIQNDGSEIKTVQEDNFIWQLVSREQDHLIAVNKNSFTVTFNVYINFRRYIEVISKAHQAFVEIFPIKHFDRLGLRYVNQIKLPQKDIDWSLYINDSLTGSLNFTNRKELRRSMHSLVVAPDQDTLVTINYGIFNQFFPAEIAENEFIIDIDAYTPFPVEVQQQDEILEKFNQTIAIYFEMSIKDKLREVMEVINE